MEFLVDISVRISKSFQWFNFLVRVNYTGVSLHSMLHGGVRISHKIGTIFDEEFIHGVPFGNISKNF